MSWQIIYTKQAEKDTKKIVQAGLKEQVEDLLGILSINPFQFHPPYEKLVGDLEGAYSRRINIKHRLVYQVYKESKTIKIIRMWTHDEQEDFFLA